MKVDTEVFISLFILVVAAVAVSIWVSTEPEGPKGPPDMYAPIPLNMRLQDDIEPEHFSVDKPTRFERVKMMTYKSLNGYEITYPSTWIGHADKAIPEGTSILERNSLFPPGTPEFSGPAVQVEVLSTAPEWLVNNPRIVPFKLNTLTGYHYKAEGLMYFIFLAENRFYRITLNSSRSNLMTEQEGLWILSTFSARNSLVHTTRASDVITITQPKTLNQTEMVTRTSRYGYEITYPAVWNAAVFPQEGEPGYDEWLNGAYGQEMVYLAPEKTSALVPAVVVSAHNGTLHNYLQQGAEAHLFPVIVNGTSGYYYEKGQATVFIFTGSKYVYNIIVTPQDHTTKQKSLWILSTFKVKDE